MLFLSVFVALGLVFTLFLILSLHLWLTLLLRALPQRHICDQNATEPGKSVQKAAKSDLGQPRGGQL